MWWTWFLNPKNILITALGACLLGLGIWFTVLKIDLNMKKAKVIEQAAQISSLVRANEILNNNAIAAKTAEVKIKKLMEAIEDLQGLVDNLPEEVKKGLQNETMERINSCLGAFFNTGVLPPVCTGVTALPNAVPSAKVEGGGSQPTK